MTLKFTLLAILCMFAVPAFAACPDPVPENTVCLEWQAPTQNVDGSAIPASGPGSIASYQIYWSLQASSFDESNVIQVTDSTLREFSADADITIDRPPGGGLVDVFFVMRATNAENEQSDNSNQVAVVVTFSPPVPGEPTILNVIINISTG